MCSTFAKIHVTMTSVETNKHANELICWLKLKTSCVFKFSKIRLTRLAQFKPFYAVLCLINQLIHKLQTILC